MGGQMGGMPPPQGQGQGGGRNLIYRDMVPGTTDVDTENDPGGAGGGGGGGGPTTGPPGGPPPINDPAPGGPGGGPGGGGPGGGHVNPPGTDADGNPIPYDEWADNERAAWTNANEPWYVPNVHPEAPWASGRPPTYTPENWGPSYTPWAPGGQVPWGTTTGGGDWRNNMQPPPPGAGLPPWMGGGGGQGPPQQPPPGGWPVMPKGQGPGNQLGPIGGDFGPPYGPGQGPGGPGGQQPNVQPPVSVYDTYASGKQMMDETLDQAIGGSVASAGFGGNRYGTAAANAVGRVGADAAAQLNDQFTNMLYNQGNQDLNRQLQATGMGLQNQLGMEQLKSGNLNQGLDRLLRGGQLGMQQGQMQEDQIAKRLQMLLGAGQQETGRQDQWDMASYQNYINQMWAPLQNMSSFMGGPGPARSEPIVSNQAGQPGAVDYIAAVAPIIAAFASDERLKTDIEDTGLEVGPLAVKTWTWERTGEPGVGFIAQDVEKVFPDAVFEVPQGTKLIDTARLVSGLQLGAS